MSYDISNTTGGMDEFHTPLKRLPDRPVYGIGRNYDHEMPHSTFTTKNPQSLFASETNTNDNVNNTTTQSNPEELVPLNKMSLKLSKSKLFNKQTDLFSRSVPKKAIYYKPPSSSNIDNQFGIEEFLPPPLHKKYPIVSKNRPYQSITGGDGQQVDQIDRIGQIDQFNQPDQKSNPTGEWINPVMKTALNRQTNKEYEIKLILTSIVTILAIKLLQRVVSLKFNISSFVNILICIIMMNMTFSGVKLIRAKDQCFDLPLSNHQRQLLGLDPVDDLFIAKPSMKPRYTKLET